MSRKGQIAIDRIVVLRSSVLPLYALIRPDGVVTAEDEVSEDGNDFLTTRMYGDQISFQSIHGYFLSAQGGEVSTKRYCSLDERFMVEKRDTQYAFRTRSGLYLSVQDHEPFVRLVTTPDETEIFQLFSLMMCGVNVGQQLDILERSGTLVLDGLLDDEQLRELHRNVDECGGSSIPTNDHECRVDGLFLRNPEFGRLSTHPVILQLVRRTISSSVKLSDVESCRTNSEYVRKELEVTSWHVVHPYRGMEFPGIVDPRISLTVTWFLSELDKGNSTWAWVPAPLTGGTHMPQLPHLSSPDEVMAITKDAKPLVGKRGAAWLYLGPVWMSNNVGAAAFWKDYDAQTRYKHLSGQKEQGGSFRALTDAQRKAEATDEQCPLLIQATYVREYVALRHGNARENLENLGEHGQTVRQLLT